IVATSNDRLLQWDEDDRARVGTGPLWYADDYRDEFWSVAEGPLGFGVSGLGTDLSEATEGPVYSLYLRRRFDLPGAVSASTPLVLEVRYNDGFIAYLNGIEIGRREMGPLNLFAYHDSYAH